MKQMSIFDGSTPFKITKPIRLIELFAGYGSQHLALKYLGVNVESYHICEWAVKSIQAYKDLHFGDDNTDYSADLTFEQIVDFLASKGISANYNDPMTLDQVKRMGEQKCRTVYNNIKATHNLVNIMQAKASDLNIVDTDKYCYIMTYSFPCFTADALVLTRTGYKRIVDIVIGDEVLTHDNKYHKVINTFDNGRHNIVSIKAMGVDEIKTTSNHKFYVREMYRKGHKSIRCFKAPVWKEVKDLTKKDYLGIAINTESRTILSDNLPTQNTKFWWLIGRYIGDGWVRSQGGIIISCDKKEINEITPNLDALGFHYCIENDKTATKIHIPKKALSDFVEQFGKGASNKHLTQDVIDLPVKYLKHFLDGYLSADGCHTNGIIKANSVSRELIYGIAQCVAKVYHTPYRVYKVKVPPKKAIQSRIVNQKDWYQLCFKTERKKQDKAFYENGYIWYPIQSITELEQENVYDIEVENAHSFTVQNTIVHNCQDLSKAGKGQGMAKDSGTRSGLLWEVERLLDECNGNLPQVLLMENVPDVVGSKNIKHFSAWLAKLESLGYKCYWKCLNAKNFGIPQNRNRCFMVSVLGDYDYDFPRELPLRLRLKHLLERQVDEKYYLSDAMVKYIASPNEKWTGNNGGAIINRDIAVCVNTRVGNTRCDCSDYICSDLPENFDLANEDVKCIQAGVLSGGKWDKMHEQSRRCYDPNGLAPTMHTCGGGNLEPKIVEPIAYDEQNKYFRQDGCVGTLTTDGSSPKHNNRVVLPNLRIRKLTPRETWRLMGVRDEEFNQVQGNQSNSSLYHLSGDSIVTTVLMAIFGMMLQSDFDYEQLSLQGITDTPNEQGGTTDEV